MWILRPSTVPWLCFLLMVLQQKWEAASWKQTQIWTTVLHLGDAPLARGSQTRADSFIQQGDRLSKQYCDLSSRRTNSKWVTDASLIHHHHLAPCQSLCNPAHLQHERQFLHIIPGCIHIRIKSHICKLPAHTYHYHTLLYAHLGSIRVARPWLRPDRFSR